MRLLFKHMLQAVCLLASLSGLAAARQAPPSTAQRSDAPQSTQRLPDASVQHHAFLEMSTPRTEYYVHEPISLTLRFGFDGAFFTSNVLQLFVQHLDVPVQVLAPWIDALAATLPVAPAAATQERPTRLTCALNDGVTQAKRVANQTRDGRELTVLEIERSYFPTTPGQLVIPEPALHFAYATTFKEDLLNGRLAVDRQDAFVRGTPLTLTIRSLPETGRPAEFGGAVGQFTVHAEVAPRTLTAGESLKLVLRVEGSGNLALFDAPRLGDVEGLRVYGMIDDKGARARTITYDLAPIADTVRVIPSIRLAFFDPTPPAGYRIVQSEPIAVEVKPRIQPPQMPRGAAAANDQATTQPGDVGTGKVGTRKRPLMLVILVIPGFAAVVVAWRRARRRTSSVAAVDAARAFRERVTAPSADVAAALVDYLASQLHCAQAAVMAPDLAAQLAQRGVPQELAHRAAAQLEALVAARYGGASLPPDPRAACDLVAALDTALGNHA